MKISISNIAWSKDEDLGVLELLNKYSVSGVEIAPTKVWADPISQKPAEVRNYSKFWTEKGKEIVATQSLLFGHPELTIFEDRETRARTLTFLTRMIEITSQLGAKVLVFGSPKNRRIGDLSIDEATTIARDFFFKLGEVSKKNGIYFCIEPNPKEYGADFILDSNEGLEIVKFVDHPNFRLHLDAGVMTVNKESYKKSIKDGFEYMKHFHISDPNLGQVGEGSTRHEEIASVLKSLGYNNWVSIEMRDNIAKSNLISVEKALGIATKIYAD